MMRVMLENFNENHIGILKEMAAVLKFEIKKLDNSTVEAEAVNINIFKQEENEMTLLSMQASEKSLAELWDKEDDAYWNSYL